MIRLWKMQLFFVKGGAEAVSARPLHRLYTVSPRHKFPGIYAMIGGGGGFSRGPRLGNSLHPASASTASSRVTTQKPVFIFCAITIRSLRFTVLDDTIQFGKML